MWFSSFLTMRRSGSRRTRLARKRSCRLILEPLEDRSLPSFLAPVSYPFFESSPIVEFPNDMAVGDFTGTGILDLVAVTNGTNPLYYSGILSVLLGKGDGTFQAAQNYPLSGMPQAVAVGDFNNDGKLDIVTANEDALGSTVSVLLGNGDGTFQPALNYSLPTQAGLNQSPVSLAVGDFDKDGKLDIAVTADTAVSGYYGGVCYTGYVNVLIGNGAGGFSADTSYALNAPYSYSNPLPPRGITVADFRGNGNLDLEVAEPTGEVGIFLGNGDGTFANPTDINTGYPDAVSVVVGDFNGDGKPDLAVGDGSTNISVLMGNGDGMFGPAAICATPGPTRPAAAADFDRDGKLDLVAGENFVLLGRGDGTFAAIRINSAAGAWPVVGDFNRDGWPDLASIGSTANVPAVEVQINAADWSAVPPPSSFAVKGFPSLATAGTPGSFTITATKADGTTVTNYSGTVHFTSSDPQAILPADYTFTTADAGAHTFSATLKTAGTQSLSVSDATILSFAGSETGISVTPAAASMLSLSEPAFTAGVPGTFTVLAFDPYGNLATGYTGTLHFTSSDSKASLPPNYTFTAADAGVHTFSVTLKTAGTQSITATDTTTASLTATDASIAVRPGAASQFIIIAPTSVTAGVQFNLTVKVEDAYGNIVTNYTGTIHFSSTDRMARLPKNYTFTAADKGVHTFTGLVLRTRGYQKITITDTLNSSLLTWVIVDVL